MVAYDDLAMTVIARSVATKQSLTKYHDFNRFMNNPAYSQESYPMDFNWIGNYKCNHPESVRGSDGYSG